MLTPTPHLHDGSDRVRILRVTGAALITCWRHLSGRRFRVEGPLPEDAEVVRTAVDAPSDTVLFVVRSATFEPVAAGDPIPELELVFRTLDED